jgi:hypothetical protein
MFMNCDALPCITGGHGCEILCSHSRVAEDSSLLGRGQGAVRQVVPDVANSAFVFRLQQMNLKMTHCELSQCQEPLTTNPAINPRKLELSGLKHYAATLSNFGP